MSLIIPRFNATLFDISRGLVPNVSHVNKWGKNPDVDTGDEDIWDGGGIYSPPTVDQVHSVVSTSPQDKGLVVSSGTTDNASILTLTDSTATFITDGVLVGDAVVNDTILDHSRVLSVDSETTITILGWHDSGIGAVSDSYRIVRAGGTGSSLVHITDAYNKSGTSIKEFVVLDGTTPVNTANSYYRISSAHLHQNGTNTKNVGTVTITANTDLTTTAQINIGKGRTQSSFIYIPYGYIAYVLRWSASVNRTGAASDALAFVELKSQLWGDDGEYVNDSAADSYAWNDFAGAENSIVTV